MGNCQATGEAGLCIQTLPPDPAKPSVLVSRELAGDMLWAGTGDHLIAVGIDPFIVHVELGGGILNPDVVTEGIETGYIVGSPLWNPNGRPDWFHYVASPGERDVMQTRLWHRETRQTFVLDVPNVPEMPPILSPDGRYLVVPSLLPEPEPGLSPPSELFVQEVLREDLGRRWSVDDLVAPTPPGTGASYQDWQP